MALNFTARIERRTWYVEGKYLGNSAQFHPDFGETAMELTGDFYGEWHGIRHFEGEAIVKAHMEREIENRRLLYKNHSASQPGEMHCHPCKLGNWGEYRIVTNAILQ